MWRSILTNTIVAEYAGIGIVGVPVRAVAVTAVTAERAAVVRVVVWWGAVRRAMVAVIGVAAMAAGMATGR